MQLRDAIEQRIPRVRKTIWANPNAYIRLPLKAGGMKGPWAELFDPSTEESMVQVVREMHGEDAAIKEAARIRREQHMFWMMDSDDDYVIYDGPIAERELEPSNYARAYTEN